MYNPVGEDGTISIDVSRNRQLNFRLGLFAASLMSGGQRVSIFARRRRASRPWVTTATRSAAMPWRC
jgi:hypothetical protein